MRNVKGYRYTPKARLLITDEDASEFLQSQFTNDLRPFEAGRCTYGLWLDVKGKVLADGYVLCEDPERFHLIAEASDPEVIRETLEAHIVADDVEVAVVSSAPALAVFGPDAETFLREAGLPVPPAGSFRRAGETFVFPGRRSVDPAYELVFDSEEEAEKTIHGFGGDLRLVDENEMNRERILAGCPAIPREVGPGDLPGEGGLETDAVSFNKGCFIGQEVVARMHHVGQARRKLFRVRGGAPLPECPARLVSGEGRKVGELRSAVPGENGWIGGALLKTRNAGAGSEVYTEAGEPVRVEEPFARAEADQNV